MLAVDLETACNVTDCPGFGGSSKCDHALSPWNGRVTCIGVVGSGVRNVYRSIPDFSDDIRQLVRSNGLVFHNGSFDIKFLIKAGCGDWIWDAWTDDTQLMIHTCTEKIPDSWLTQYEEWRKEENKRLPQGVSHRAARGNSLKTNAPYWLGIEPFWENPADHDSDEYVLKDCEYTLRLYNLFNQKLKDLQQYGFYKNRMMSWTKMLTRAELRGISLDSSRLAEMKVEYADTVDALRAELDETWIEGHRAYLAKEKSRLIGKYSDMANKAISKLKEPDVEKEMKIDARYYRLLKAAQEKLPDKINYDSPKQMLWLLRDHLQLPVKNFQGEESTGKAVLQDLASGGREDIKLYLDWRQAHKIATAFLPTYEKLADSQQLIHPNFNLTGTRTGRLSSSSPNCQQIPSKLYSIFKPRPGYTFLQHDEAAIEAKLIALYSNDVNIMDAARPGHSIHNANATSFFGLDCRPEDVPDKHPAERRAAKTVGFALFYGAGSNRIKHAFTAAGFPTSDKEAKEKHKAFKSYYETAIKFHRSITKVFEAGDIVENLFGRPLKIQVPEQAYMKGFNTLIQSSASDLVLRSAEKAERRWREEGLDCHLLLFVHDFILAECNIDDAQRADEILVECMTDYTLTNELGSIKLEVDGGIGNEWSK